MMDKSGTSVSVTIEEQRLPDDTSNGKVKILSWRGGKLSKIVHDFKTIGKEYGTSFKEIIVNKEPEALSNRDKIINKTDSKSHLTISSEQTPEQGSCDSSINKPNGCINVPSNKSVIVIKSKSGKTVTIGPKPVRKVETNVSEKPVPMLRFDDVINISEKKIFITQNPKIEKQQTIVQNIKPLVNSSQDNRVYQYPGKVPTGTKPLNPSSVKQETPVAKIIQHPTPKSITNFFKESLPKFVPNSVTKTPIKILPKPMVKISSDVKKSAAFLVNPNSATKMKVDIVKTSDKNLLDKNKLVQNPSNNSCPVMKVASNKVNMSPVSTESKPATIPITPNISIQKPINVKIALPYQKTDKILLQNSHTKNIIPVTKPIAAVKMNCIVSPTIIAEKKNGEIKKSPTLMKKHVEVSPNIVNTKKPRRIPNLTIRTECMTFCPNERESHDASTQTFKPVLTNTSVQTDLKNIQECEEPPGVQELVEYLMSTTNSMNDLMQTNCATPTNTILETTQNEIISDFPPLEKTTNSMTRRDNMKLQFFTNLRYCVYFDNEGNLPIHKAVLENNLKEIKKQNFFLKTRNQDINIPSNYGQTALHVAVINGICNETINELLTFGANCNLVDPDGNSVLHLSVLHRDAPTMSFLIGLCNKDTIDATNDDGLTALMLACINKKQDLAEILLKHGADPNIQDGKSGRTAFFYAVEIGAYELAEFLVKHNADPKIKNYLGIAALDGIKEPQLLTMTMLEDIRNSYKRSYSNDEEDDPEDESYSPKEKKPSKKSTLSFITCYQKVTPKDFKEMPNKRRKRTLKRVVSQE